VGEQQHAQAVVEPVFRDTFEGEDLCGRGRALGPEGQDGEECESGQEAQRPGLPGALPIRVIHVESSVRSIKTRANTVSLWEAPAGATGFVRSAGRDLDGGRTFADSPRPVQNLPGAPAPAGPGNEESPHMKSFPLVSAAVLPAVLACGCSSMSHTENGALAGGALGAGAGALIGHATGHTGAGALIGAGVGALSGGLVGHAVDKSEERAVAAAQQARGPLGMTDVVQMAQAHVTD